MKKKNSIDTEQRFKLFNSITGQEICTANNLAAFRELYSESEARFLTVLDNQENIFMGGSMIFKDAAELFTNNQ